MSIIKEWLVSRFPTNKASINQLWGTHSAFEATTKDFYEVEHRLAKLNPSADPAEPGELERLRSRRDSLERELIGHMGPNRR